jgi:hypothetical protein
VPHTLYILDKTGHTELLYAPDDADRVEEVRAEFDKIIAQGYLAYAWTPGPNGEEGDATVIRKFDPSLPAIRMSPQIVGG